MQQIITDPLSVKVYRVVRDEIVHGRLAQGERLDVAALSTSLGVSKTPLRGALTRLEGDGLVVTKPRSGTFVATITASDIEEVCGLRKATEWFATYEATFRMPMDVKFQLRDEIQLADQAIAGDDWEPFYLSDMNLHRSIIEYSGNTRLITLRDSIEAYLEWLRIVGSTGRKRLTNSAARHHQIINAMIEGDAVTAQCIAALHVDEVRLETLEDFADASLATIG